MSSSAALNCTVQNVTQTPAAIFQNTASIVTGHTRTPRFGHTNNITELLAGGATKSDVNNYVVGLFGAAIVMFSFVLLWFIVIVFMRCMGYKVVGFLSGSSVRIPVPPPSAHNRDDEENQDDGLAYARPDDYPGTSKANFDETTGDNGLNGADAELEAWKASVATRERRIRNIRIAVIISGLIIVVMSVLMVVFGIQSLNRSVSEGRAGLSNSSALATRAVALIDTYMENQNNTVEAAQSVLNASNRTLCPAARDLLCANFDCNQIFDTLPTILDYKDQVVAQLVSTRGDLTQVATMLDDINDTIGKFDWAFWVAAGAVILMAVCTLLILNGVILAWQNKLHGTCWQRTTSCFRGWLVVPLFIFLLLVGWVFSMVFVVGSTATADFCYNSPDQNVQAFLNANKEKFSSNSIVYPTLVYYVSGCPGESVIQGAGLQIAGLIGVYQEFVSKAASLLASQSTLLANECNTDPATLQNALLVLEAQSCTITTSLYEVLNFFTCENFNSIYATVAYDAVCYNGNSGFVWISATQFVILLCAMIMLTLRVAFYELVDESELIEPRRCLSCCRRNREIENPDNDLLMKEETRDVPEHDGGAVNRSLDSGDGFDDMVHNAVAQAYDESENGHESDGEEKPRKAS